MTNVRVRGIYATALTRLLREADGPAVVQASPPIERRFDAAFPQVEYDVTVRTTGDRQGVGVTGDPDGVEAVAGRLRDVGLDAFAWADEAPRGAVFEAEVTETRGRGAIVALGSREGFLPYDDADGYVDRGDRLRVQVHDPEPPWSDRRPVVGTDVRTFGGLVSLVRGGDGPTADVPDDGRAAELVRSLDLLAAEVPDGWAVRFRRGAGEAELSALDDALERSAEMARTVERGLDEGSASPAATTWVWFGRESRFALDGRRREVVPTMPGHHRIKAGTERASDAVDFAERVCEPSADASAADFPFAAVADQFGPAVGDEIRLEHGKPDGRRFSLGRGTVTDRTDDGTITVRRAMTGGGTYDALAVAREDGDEAITRLAEGRWWYPTVYRDEAGARKGTYVNVCTPVELFPGAATYVDLQVDVVKHADGSVERVDDDELDADVDAGLVAPALAEKARSVATAVERALSE